MAANFGKLKSDLEKIGKDAWDADTKGTFASTLRMIFGKEAKDKYIECTLSTAFDECLRKAAEEAGLGDKYSKAWNAAPSEMRKKLKEIGAKWGKDERAAVKAVMRGADVPRLFKLCATGHIDEVATELDIDTPAHYKDCVRAVAGAKDLTTALKNLWPEEA